MEKIVFLERASVRARVRRPAFAHEWAEYDATEQAQVVARLKDATIAILNKTALKANDLAALPDLKLIAVAATGVDKVDVAACKARGVAVCNIRHYAVHSVPEHVFMLLLALRRKLLNYRREVRAGAWQKSQQFCLLTHPINDLYGSTCGVIGYGALGRATAQLAEGFGMRVIIAEHKDADEVRAGRMKFAEVLRASDVLTLHCPLNETTRDLIAARELAEMKPSALLINTARGGIVNETDLLAALRNGQIAGAGFDVLSREPPQDGNPLLNYAAPNFILTPHVAWASDEAMQTLAEQLIDNLEAFVAGTPRNLL